MARKEDKIARFQLFESVTGKERKYRRDALSLEISPAWLDLSAIAREMYHEMKRQYNGRPNKEIAVLYGNVDMERLTRLFFYNQAIAIQSGLYGRTRTGEFGFNARTFRQARQELIDHGFIQIFREGKGQGNKTIYEFIPNWKQWKK